MGSDLEKSQFPSAVNLGTVCSFSSRILSPKLLSIICLRFSLFPEVCVCVALAWFIHFCRLLYLSGCFSCLQWVKNSSGCMRRRCSAGSTWHHTPSIQNQDYCSMGKTCASLFPVRSYGMRLCIFIMRHKVFDVNRPLSRSLISCFIHHEKI